MPQRSRPPIARELRPRTQALRIKDGSTDPGHGLCTRPPMRLVMDISYFHPAATMHRGIVGVDSHSMSKKQHLYGGTPAVLSCESATPSASVGRGQLRSSCHSSMHYGQVASTCLNRSDATSAGFPETGAIRSRGVPFGSRNRKSSTAETTPGSRLDTSSRAAKVLSGSMAASSNSSAFRAARLL